jgi:taurine dioxygenase
MREGDDERLEVRASKNSKYVAGEDWHSDVSCDAEPPFGSMLYITELPEIGCGGDTLFANMYLAYDLLSDAMKEFLGSLTAVHDGAIPWVGSYGYKPDRPFNKTEHPVVTRHPDTGRKVLFVNRGFTSHIVQLSRAESAGLLEVLYRTIEANPLITCRVRWTPNALVFWDNRCTQHHALWDYYPLSRSGHRVSIVGQRPSA